MQGVLALKAWVGGDSMRERVRAKVMARLGDGIELGPNFSVDWFGAVTLGPMVIAASQARVAPVVKVAKIVARPRWAALVRGALEVGSIRFEDVTVEAGDDGAELRSAAERLRRPRAGASASATSSGGLVLPEVSFERLVVRSTFRARALELVASSGHLVVHRDESGETHLEGFVVPGVPGVEGGGAIRVLAALSDDGLRAASVTLDQGVALTSIVPLKGFALMPSNGTLRGAAQLSSRKHHRLGELSWQLVFDALTFSNARLASEPVGPMQVSASGSLKWDVEARQLTVTQLTLGFGHENQIVVESDGSIEQLGDDTVFVSQAHSVDLDYQRAVSSLP